MRLMAGLLVVLLAACGGAGQGSSSGGPSAAVEPSVAPTAEPTPSPASAPPLTQSFTSTLHGISLSYPEGWTAQAATEPWTGAQPIFSEPSADLLYDPNLTDHLFLSIASQPIGDSTPEDWVAAQMDEACGTAPEPIEVDGASGLTGSGDCTVAVVTTAGRGYWIHLLTSTDDPLAVAAYDRGWFEEVLATVQLKPEDAVD